MPNDGVSTAYQVARGDFAAAGEASGDIKRRLKLLGVDSNLTRRVAVAAYEVEMNLIIHSLGGRIGLDVDSSAIALDVVDVGPGIPDLDLAMREGYSTAPDEIRMLGFGAGMGLPNMKRNADEFHIESAMGEGTHITMRFGLE
jgi:anti-sigma regulatory factor (Ser/Thr protein kinase)